MPDKKKCFVVGPIGAADSPERIHADWFLEEIVEPAMKTHEDFEVIRSDRMAQPGLIDAQMINLLLNAELVVADLTGVNANAFYEIGIRHMAQKPIIHMHETGAEIPFDISLYRSIEFSRVRPSDLRQACRDLGGALEAVFADGYEVTNPVTNALGRAKFEQTATPDERLLADQLRAIERRLSNIENNKSTDYIEEIHEYDNTLSNFLLIKVFPDENDEFPTDAVTRMIRKIGGDAVYISESPTGELIRVGFKDNVSTSRIFRISNMISKLKSVKEIS